MVSKEDITCVLLSNSDESDSETVPQSHSLDEPDRQQQQQVKKRNKALQVRFKDICDAQNERRGRRSRSISCKVTHRKYMTMPARRAIPNVTKSTGVQTSPDLTKHYKTFPFERKRGHTFKHAALVEDYKGQNNGFLSDIKAPEDSMGITGKPSGGKGKIVGQTKALLHHTDDSSGTEDLLSSANCVDGPSCSDSSRLPDEAERRPTSPAPKGKAEHQVCGARTAPKGLPVGETGSFAKRQLANSDDVSQDIRSKGMGKGGGWSRGRVGGGPVAWNSLTRVQSLGSPASACCKRKKASPLNGQQSQTLPHSAKCSAETQGRCRTRHVSASSKVPQAGGDSQGFSLGMSGGPGLGASQQIMSSPPGDKDIKAQLQAMESLVTSSQETIKVLLGVIQELEKGEAHREGLSYRTGQDTANCDTCRNSACIIYSVELDFKQQEDKLQPLIKRLCPQEGPQCPSLPYPDEVFTSTPKRKNKTESKKHARWKLWFL